MAIVVKTPGVHHITLRSANLERSKRFYRDVLGFSVVVEAPGIFIFFAGSTAVAVRGPEAETPPGDRFSPFRVGLDHIALACADEQELHRVASALAEAGVENTGVKVDPTLNRNYVAFKDPDHIKWEFYMAKNPNVEIAESYFRGLGQKDFTHVPFAPDLVFESPLTPRLSGAKAVREFLEAVFPVIKGVRIQQAIADGDHLAVRFELETTCGAIPACDYLRISNGQIAEIRPYYDPRPVTKTAT
jgi:glyoxylase I family protein